MELSAVVDPFYIVYDFSIHTLIDVFSTMFSYLHAGFGHPNKGGN